MAKNKAPAEDTSFHQTGPFHNVVGSPRPRQTTDVRVNEVNTQRFAAGSRGGTTAGQGPALDSK